ncbi:MAG: ABC transporter substrate-binding protein [Candidatus Binatia bacterium]
MTKAFWVQGLKILAFFLSGFTIMGVSPGRSAAAKLTLAMLRSATQMPYYAAIESGFYRTYGLEVLPVQFSGGTQTIMALVSGDVQITTTGGPAAINARLKGGHVITVGTNVGVFPYILYVSDKVRKPEDLKGKRVGIAGFGGATHFAMIYALRKLQLNPETDVTLTQLGNASARLGAMVSGSIVATLIQPPESLKARELGFKPLINLARSGVKFANNQVTTTDEYLKNRRPQVKKFMMGSIAGLARIKGDVPFAMKLFQKYLAISDPKIFSEAYEFWTQVYSPKFYVEPEEIETYLMTLKDRDGAKPDEFFDNSIVAELDREGFIDAIYKKYKK